VNLLALTVSSELVSNASILAISELDHAGIVHVVHEVIGGVVASIIRAGVHNAGAAVVGGLLSGGIIDTITTSHGSASTLEGVVQTHPVADLVGASVTLIVVGGRSTGQRGVQNHDTIHIGLLLITGGEGSPTQQTTADVGEVQVQVISRSLSQGGLHVSLGRGLGTSLGRLDGEPLIIDGNINRVQDEGPATLGVGIVQHLDLGSVLRIRDGTSTSGVVDGVNVNLDGSTSLLLLQGLQSGLGLGLNQSELLGGQIGNTAAVDAVIIVVVILVVVGVVVGVVISKRS